MGAKIHIRRGRRSGGAFHCKGAAVNRRCLYTGSPNDDDDDDDDDNIGQKGAEISSLSPLASHTVVH